MKINIYKNQTEIEKTYEVENYDLMYGTVQDVLAVMDKGIPDLNDNEGMLNLLIENRTKLEDLLLDVFFLRRHDAGRAEKDKDDRSGLSVCRSLSLCSGCI